MYTYLIVDDEMIERKGIRMLLSWMNIRENILEASNGEEALEVFEKEKIDVLLTDINMPFMDGIELLSRIHEEYPGTETVIFSGYDEFSYAKKAISYGVSAYILKPVNPEEFKKVVGEITEKLAKSEREEKRKDESMEFLREHLLYLMVNGQSRSAMQEKTQMLLDMSFVRDFCRMVLLECANNYFEQVNSEQIENCASHSRYFSDELDAQNFYQKEEQMFDIFLCIWYTIFMKKDMFTINKNGLSYGRGYVYSLQYHLVWCTKYRKKVLKDGIDVECKEMLESLAQEYKFQILAMEVMPDHIHLLVDCRPQFYISDMIKIMKGNLARQMFLLHPELKKELWGGHLWNPSYCAVTVSDRSREQVLAYIEGQKEKSR